MKSIRCVNSLCKTLNALGEDPFIQTQSLHYVREYLEGALGLVAPSDAVLQVTRKPAENFETIVRRYSESEPLAKRSMSNIRSVIWSMIRSTVLPAKNVKAWKSKQGRSSIDSEEYCIDS